MSASSEPAIRTGGLGRVAPWLLVMVVLVIYLPGISQMPLLDRDESRFATAAREMMERGTWIVPTFNGHERLDKPPLIYWMMRAGYAMVGVNELGARLPAVASMVALVLLVWSTGKRWFGESEGFSAALMLATSLQFFIHGRLAVADMPMVLCVAWACVALAELLIAPRNETDSKTRTWWSLWIALGLGFLAKGPIALLLPAIALVLWRWVFWRASLPWERLRIGRGLLVTFGIVATWGLPALWLTVGRFWEVGIGENVIRRGYEKFNDRSYHVLFYLGTAFVSLFPWIIFAGLATLAVRRHWDARRAWLVSWFLAPYLVFTPYATQLPHYVLPGFPAAFLILGSLGKREFEAVRWQRSVIAWTFAIVGTALAVALLLIVRIDLPVQVKSLRHCVLGGLVTLGGLLVVASAWWFQRLLFTALGILLLSFGAQRLGTGLRAINPAVAMKAQWSALPAETRFVGWHFAEPSLVFYSDARWSFANSPMEFAESLSTTAPVLVVALERECDPLGYFTGRVQWREEPLPSELAESVRQLQVFEGLNTGRFRWQRISVRFRPAKAE